FPIEAALERAFRLRRIELPAFARIIAGLSVYGDVARAAVETDLWRVDDVDLGRSGDRGIGELDVVQLKPPVLAATKARQHRARKPDLAQAAFVEFNIDLIIKTD